MWNAYNLLLIVAAMMTAFERPQRRRHHRIGRVCEARPVLDGPRRVGTTVDISMGGLSMSLPGLARLPDEIGLELSDGHTLTPPLPFKVVYQREGVNALHARGYFLAMDPAEQAGLGTILFSGSHVWTSDQYAPDSVLRSWVTVIVAALMALIRRPEWTQRIIKPLATVPLVHMQADVSCEVCRRMSGVATGSCEWCGAALVMGKQTGFTEATARRAPWTALIGPSGLLFLGVALALGWSPLVKTLNQWVPVERGHDTCATQRRAELQEAHDGLTLVQLELADALLAHRLPRRTLGAELDVLRTDFQLYGDPSRCFGCESWESAMHAAVQALDAADSELRAGLSQDILESRIRRASLALAELDQDDR